MAWLFLSNAAWVSVGERSAWFSFRVREGMDWSLMGHVRGCGWPASLAWEKGEGAVLQISAVGFEKGQRNARDEISRLEERISRRQEARQPCNESIFIHKS